MKLWCVALITSAFLVGCAGTQPSAGGMKENEIEKATIKVAKETVMGGYTLVSIDDVKKMIDAKEAVKTIKTIQYSARVAGRKIPFAVLFTRLSAAIITKTGKHLAAEFDGAGVDLFECSLIDREAFKSVFSYGGTVNGLEGSTKREQESIKKAADNAKIFAEEVKRKLKTSIDQKRAANG